MESCEALANHFGFEVCESEVYEQGVQKIAFFEKDGKLTHVCRQLDSGQWASKLGKIEDIVHSLRSIEGETYGNLHAIFKKIDLP